VGGAFIEMRPAVLDRPRPTEATSMPHPRADLPAQLGSIAAHIVDTVGHHDSEKLVTDVTDGTFTRCDLGGDGRCRTETQTRRRENAGAAS